MCCTANPGISRQHQHRVRRTIYICVLLALASAPALSIKRDLPLKQLYHTSWTAKDGLSGSIKALAQTKDGFLWIGTTDGLFRFDGVYFEPYKPESGSLPTVSVSCLLATSDGGLWIGYQLGGATFLKDGHATTYSERDGFPVSTVRALVEDHDGMIWASAVGGFVRLEGSRWQSIRMNWNYPSRFAWTLLVDDQGTLWVPNGREIMYLPKGEKTFRQSGIQVGQVLAFVQAPDGTLMFADAEKNRLRSFRSPLDTRKSPLLQVDSPAKKVLFDHDGAMWIAGHGLARLRFPELLGNREVSLTDSEVERLTKNDALTDDLVESILEDAEGNIWAGTSGGLDRFRYRNVTWFPFPSGVHSFSLLPGNNGEILTGSRGDKPWSIARAVDAKPVEGTPDSVYLMYRDPDGSIWVSARGRLVHWKDGVFTDTTPPEEMLKLQRSSPSKDPITVLAMTKDASGTLWASYNGGGLFQLKDGRWEFTVIHKDYPDYSASSAYTDAGGRVWLTYPKYLAMAHRGSVRVLSAEADLPAIGPYNLITGRAQQVWLGGESGVAFLKDDRFHVLQGVNGHSFGSIRGIVSSHNDGLWLSAGPNIVHISEAEVQRALQEPDYKVNYEVFDLASDLPEQLQRTYSYSSTVVQGTDGSLWFAARTGIVRINPTQILRNPLPPPVSIKAFVADGKLLSSSGNVTLPALTNTLRIEYTALSLTIPERVMFRYRLEGWDKEWHDAGARREAFYTGLGPGNYTFRVIACNNDGVWNQTGVSLAFSVAPAWYQTNWFWLLCLMLAALVVWIIYRLRVRRVTAAMSVRFDERLAERVRLAQELHDTFLQTVQASKMVADDALDRPLDPERMQRAIKQLSVWLAQATVEGRAALDSLRSSSTEKNDLAEALRRATANAMLPGNMAVSFSAAGDAREMHPIVRDEIYRIGYEAIRNAFAHSRASRLEVALRYGQDLSLRVSDNGVGIDPVIVAAGKPGHFGLQGMRERAERIDGRLTLVSSPDSGTELTLVVPGAIVFRKPNNSRFTFLKSLIARLRRDSKVSD